MKLKDIAKAVKSSRTLTLHQMVDAQGEVTRQWVSGCGATYALPDDLPKARTGNELLAMLDADWREDEGKGAGSVAVVRVDKPAIEDTDGRDEQAALMQAGFTWSGMGFQGFTVTDDSGREVRLVWPSLLKPVAGENGISYWRRGRCLICKQGMLALAAIGFCAPWEAEDGRQMVDELEELVAMMGIRLAEHEEEQA